MLDFNHQPKFHEQLGSLIDAALVQERNQQSPRRYLGASRLGVACERALQYEYLCTLVDPGREIPGRILRIFEVGHALEDLAIRWLRLAGFDLYTQKSSGGQFGFSVAGSRIQGHVDGVLNGGPAELGMTYPALWECKTMNDKSWRDTVKHGISKSKPVYAAQMAVYQAYMEAAIPGISRNPALFTAINKDTQEIWFEQVAFDGGLAQRMSDRAVRVICASEAGELLPRHTTTPTHVECKFCPWQDRCWGKT
ncbi:PD-(D/E)XK nuclease family protein [Ferrovum sp.]|uniref:PD-(D/E)XK nuclease family protein n=1 Tax=Ferrovum sp. TaxID=2609467 RepID=UPI0026153005|nr:PD-(D/E)XK nuclease family protein [Ferrovum sp.]